MSALEPAEIDVVVPVHDARRPLTRLLRSVLTDVRARVRVIVVCHDIEPDDVREGLARDVQLAGDERVELVGFRDGVRSPAGPLTRGLEHVRAPYFTKIDSDDSLAPGALDAWLTLARQTGAHAVMPVMDWPGSVPTPPLRPLSLRGGARLDPVADRLAYRTSTMGLLARSLRSRAVPTPGLATGEDIVPGLRVWFSGARIVWGGPRAVYRVHDGVDRATAGGASGLGVAQRLGFVEHLVADPVLRGAGRAGTGGDRGEGAAGSGVRHRCWAGRGHCGGRC
ncbi:glycosyltransferase [Salana multivorans]